MAGGLGNDGALAASRRLESVEVSSEAARPLGWRAVGIHPVSPVVEFQAFERGKE